MKISIEIEVSPDEYAVAAELIQTLRQLTDQVKMKTKGGASASAKFLSLLNQMEDPAQAAVAGNEIQKIFADQLLASSNKEDPALAKDFLDTFTSVIFNPDLVVRQKPIAPYIFLIARLPEAYKIRIRDSLLQQILKFLTIKRPVDCNRVEFFAHAEAFAALVKLEFVSVTGAIQTINTLLSKAENRSAAITMLGKTVELCLDVLHEKCDATQLATLKSILDSIKDPAFNYDVDYIKENMFWRQAQTAAAAAAAAPGTSSLPVAPGVPPVMPGTLGVVPAAPATTQLVGRASYDGHRSVIFAMAYDELRDTLLSSAKDGVVLSWGIDGKQKDSFSLGRRYACSMDVNSHQRSLFLCGVGRDEEALPPALYYYGLDESSGTWKQRGVLEKKNMLLISCVKTLSQSSNLIVTGEHTSANNFYVQLYDAKASTAFEKMSPVVTFEEHMDMVTCLSTISTSEDVFLSGSRDKTIKLWDRRLPKSVGSLVGHTGMVTSIDAYDNIVVSGGRDNSVLVWDLRQMAGTAGSMRGQPMRSVPVDDSGMVLKVAMGPMAGDVSLSGTAISTLSGLYYLNFASGMLSPAALASPAGAPHVYHDLRWNAARNVLFAGGEDSAVHVYQLAAAGLR